MLKRLYLTRKHKDILEQMDQLEINEKALYNYRYCVRKNKFEDEDILVRKLKRNFILAKQISEHCKNYGNLYIFYNGNEITNIYNELNRKPKKLEVDLKTKEDLDYILNI